MFSSSKYCGDEQFSTTQMITQSRQNKTYSSRYLKYRQKARSSINKSSHRSVEIYLPSSIEKAAIVIQRFWRYRLLLRRKYYQKLLPNLLNKNTIQASLLKHKTQFQNSLNEYNKNLKDIIKGQIDNKMKHKKKQLKLIAKHCVGLSFRLQKKMISEQQLSKLDAQNAIIKKKIIKLSLKKQNLQNTLFDQKLRDQDEILLREIKEANINLLKAVEKKNKARQQLYEKIMMTGKTSQK